MRQDAKRVAIAESSVLQQLTLRKEVVDLVGDIGAFRTGHQQAHPVFMGCNVCFPNLQAGRVDLTYKHRPLECRVIPRDHWESI